MEVDNTPSAMNQSIKERLRQRNRRTLNEVDSDMVKQYQKVQDAWRQLIEKKTSLETECALLRGGNRDPKEVEILKQRIQELEVKLTVKLEEITNLYASYNKLNEVHKDSADSLSSKTIALDDLKKRYTDLEDKYHTVNGKLAEKEKTMIYVEKDNSTLREMNGKILKELETLRSENNMLLSSIKYETQKVGDKLNQLNEWQEDLFDQKRAFEVDLKLFMQEKEAFQKKVKEMKTGVAGPMNMFDNYAIGEDSPSSKGGKPDEMYFGVKASKKLKKLHNQEINDVSQYFNGRCFATAGGDSLIKVVDPFSQTVRFTMHGANSTQVFTCLAFGEDIDILLSGSTDRVVQLWSLGTSRVKHSFLGHTDKIMSLAFVMDKERCMSGSSDRTMKLWNCSKGYIEKTINCISSCNSIQVATQNFMIYSAHADKSIKIWSMKNYDKINELKGVHEMGITDLKLSNDNVKILTAARDSTLKLIDTRMYSVVMTYRSDNYTNSIDFNKVSFGKNESSVVAGSADGKIFVWNAISGKLENTFTTEHEGQISCVSYNSTTGYTVSTDTSGNAIIWQ